MTDDLMTIDDIAAMYRCSRRHARDTITKLVGFPNIVRGSSQRIPLWKRRDVAAFLGDEQMETRTNPASEDICV